MLQTLAFHYGVQQASSLYSTQLSSPVQVLYTTSVGGQILRPRELRTAIAALHQ